MRAFVSRAIGPALVAAALLVPVVCEAYKGRVIDGATGQPIEGVYVIGRWEGGGGFVVSSSGCTLAFDKSNANGEFELVGGVGFWGRLFGPSSRPFVFFYRPGFIEPERYPNGTEPWTLIPDNSPAAIRIKHLYKLQGFMDCGVEKVRASATDLAPIYRDMIAEAYKVARTTDERMSAAGLYFWLDVVEVGWDEAGQRSRTRLEQARRQR